MLWVHGYDEAHGRMVAPRDFAALMWPESRGWKEGLGRPTSTGLARKAGGFLRSLAERGYVTQLMTLLDWNEWQMTAEGKNALREEEGERE